MFAYMVEWRNQKFRVTLSLLIAAIIGMSFFQTPAKSTDYSDPNLVKLEKQRNDELLARQEKELKKLLKEKNAVAKVIDKLDGEVRRAETALSNVQKKHKKLQSETVYLDQKSKIAEKKYEDYRKRNHDRLVAFYKNGRAGYLEVLFNATSFTDFISRTYYLRLLTEHDLDVIVKMKQLSIEVTEQKQKLLENAKQVATEEARLKENQRYNQKLHAQKKKVILEIEGEEALVKQQIKILERENSDLENLLKQARNMDPITTSFSGKFASPVCNNQFYITSPYGVRKSPKRRASTNHKGVDLRAKHNSDVCAAADGIVLESSWARGYGNHIVIRHGSEYATVYGHGKKNLVKKGQKVKQGQVIMKADSTGVSTGSHLHFEIRKDGIAIEPTRFFCGYAVNKGNVVCN